MERRIFFGILSLSLIALAVAILLPGGRTVDQNPKLPWNISIDQSGALSVLDLTLGKSTLGDARELFQAEGKANLFLNPDNQYSVEVYFQRLYLSGLRADIVTTLDIDQQTAEEMFNRGLRISNVSSGGKKIKLSAADLDSLQQTPIRYLTYGPAADLEESLLVSRFGEPNRRIPEPETGIVHWLYPAKGLEITFNPDGKELFQYINPGEFDRLREPLKQLSEARE